LANIGQVLRHQRDRQLGLWGWDGGDRRSQLGRGTGPTL